MNRRQFIQYTASGSAALTTMSLSASTWASLIIAPNNDFPKLETFSFEFLTVDRRGGVIAKQISEARYFTEVLNESASFDMIAIDGGQTLLGDTDRSISAGAYECKPQCADIAPHYIGRTAITQNQWRAVAALPPVLRELSAEPSCFTGDDHPVECVSWHDAQEFCARLSVSSGRNYRLPTEAEWESACRAGTISPFNVGATLTSKLANYGALQIYDAEQCGTYHRSTVAVGQFAPNAYGLYDMHGNVWEWCADAWHDVYRNEGTPIVSDASWRALRGGSWSDTPAKLRSASRTGYAAESLNRIIGFRIALSLGET